MVEEAVIATINITDPQVDTKQTSAYVSSVTSRVDSSQERDESMDRTLNVLNERLHGLELHMEMWSSEGPQLA